jgi:heat shock protein HslJ
MRIIGRYALVLVAGGILAACTSTDKKMVVTPTEVEGKTWVLSSLNGHPPVDGKRVTIEFQSASDKDGKIIGRGPCNGYFGSYAMEQDELQFGRIGSTMIACPEPVMKQEMEYMSAFQKVDTMTSNGSMLTLKSRHSDDKIVFMPEDSHLRGMVKSTTGYFPAESDVRIQLRDTSKQDVRSSLIGESKVKLKYELDGPLNFDVPYSRSLIKPGHTYSVSVEVRHKGKLVSRSATSNIVDLGKPLDMESGSEKH